MSEGRSLFSHPCRTRERRDAQAEAQRAIRARQLLPGPCNIGLLCQGRIEAHHLDYRRPLEVIWLCHRHYFRAECAAAEELVYRLKRALTGATSEPIDIPQVRAQALEVVRRAVEVDDSLDTHTCAGMFNTRVLGRALSYLRKARRVLAERAVAGNL